MQAEADPEMYRVLRFVDGLRIDPANCPGSIHARSHWNDDGTCRCKEKRDGS